MFNSFLFVSGVFRLLRLVGALFPCPRLELVKLSVQMMSSRLFRHVGRVVRKTQIAKTQQTLNVLGRTRHVHVLPLLSRFFVSPPGLKARLATVSASVLFCCESVSLKMCDHACLCSCNPSIMFMSSNMWMCFHVHVIYVRYVHMFQHGHVFSCSCLSMFIHVHVHVS